MRRQVRDATVEVLEGIMQLLEVILSSPLQRYTRVLLHGDYIIVNSYKKCF